MDLAADQFERRPGLPPDGEQGLFLGFDRAGRPYVLRWFAGMKCWRGVGFDPKHPIFSFSFLARQEMAGFIVAHAPVEALVAGGGA
jgi:hypothetical protein